MALTDTLDWWNGDYSSRCCDLSFIWNRWNATFSAEAPGPSADKLKPKITDTAKRLWLIYLGYTVIETILLYFAGMGAF